MLSDQKSGFRRYGGRLEAHPRAQRARLCPQPCCAKLGWQRHHAVPGAEWAYAPETGTAASLSLACALNPGFRGEVRSEDPVEYVCMETPDGEYYWLSHNTVTIGSKRKTGVTEEREGQQASVADSL